MKKRLLLAGVALFLTTVIGVAEEKQSKPVAEQPKLYNEVFNPRQKEYPNHLGFNDHR